jgi:hypothetical protein
LATTAAGGPAATAAAAGHQSIIASGEAGTYVSARK